MRFARCVFVVIILSWFGALAHADTVPVDPKMQVSDPTCGVGCTIVTGTSFSFSSNVSGGGFLTFENQSDSNWSSLLIETTGIAANSVNASSNLFSNPVLVYNIGDLLVIYFSGVSGPNCIEGCFPGIPNTSDQNVLRSISMMISANSRTLIQTDQADGARTLPLPGTLTSLLPLFQSLPH